MKLLATLLFRVQRISAHFFQVNHVESPNWAYRQIRCAGILVGLEFCCHQADEYLSLRQVTSWYGVDRFYVDQALKWLHYAP